MIAVETMLAVAIKARRDSITIVVPGFGIMRCPTTGLIASELRHWVRHPLRIKGLAARSSRGRLVALTVHSFEVLPLRERASGAELIGIARRTREQTI